MENFDPDSVSSFEWHDTSAGVVYVRASDYGKLLTLYRGAVDNAEGYKGTIKTIWTQLGDPTYEELKGRGIFEVIQELIDKVHPQSTTTIVTSGTTEIK